MDTARGVSVGDTIEDSAWSPEGAKLGDLERAQGDSWATRRDSRAVF